MSLKVKWEIVLPAVLMVVFAMTRWPGVMPWNFSAAYGLAFCAGLYFSGPARWILPLLTLGLTDVFLNLHYGESVINAYSLVSLTTFSAIIWLGTKFSPRWPWIILALGGVAGAFVFYIVTNTISWLADPAYAKTFAGWLQAITFGRPGFPATWEFFRNTLMSGGLFTALFSAVMKLSEPVESKETESEDSEEEVPNGKPTSEPAK